MAEFPEFWGLHESLAGAYLKAGNRELALKHYEKALRLDPGNSELQKDLEQLRN